MTADTSALSRTARFPASQRKIRAPFVLDPSLCLYSPQENVDSLSHPLIAEWITFITERWEPASDGRPRVALLVPCCKYKPYPVSREHRAINAALLAAGWRPSGGVETPSELLALLDEGEDPAVLDVSAWERDGIVLDRFVISEPLGVVPYPLVYRWHGRQSPATSYDDPGLFEARGTSVSPEHPGFTATPAASGGWKWGPGEREAYVLMHNRMAEVIAQTFRRVGDAYAGIGAWLSPGLTHRSFLAGSAQRDLDGLARSRRGHDDRELPLIGVGDLDAPDIAIMPTQDDLDRARTELAERLTREGRGGSPGAVRAVYARGDGNDTPLGLPEALRALTRWLDETAVRAGSAVTEVPA